MWFWKIFMISFSLASIWLDLCGCAPYKYFGVGDNIVANSDVQQSKSKSGSRMTLVKQVSETKSTNNSPTRGLYYPDDMFFTNWKPNEFGTEDCSKGQESVTTTSGSTSKCTFQLKNNDESTKYQTSLGQQKSTFAGKSSLNHQQTSTLAMLSSSSTEQTSTSAELGSSRRLKTSIDVVTRLPRRQRTSTFAVLTSSRRVQRTSFVPPSFPRRSKTSRFLVSMSTRKKQKSIPYEQSTTSWQQNSDFRVPTSISRKRKYSVQRSLGHQRELTFDEENPSSLHQMSTRSLVTTTVEALPDLDYISYN